MKSIAKALLAAQQEMSNPVKESSNPFFRSKYADLNAVREAVMPALNKYGIVVLQPTVHIDGKNFVQTMLLHESGETIESITEILYSKPNDAQAQGSGISYARRYGLQSLVCVGAEDDDANTATPQNNPAKKNEPAPEAKPAKKEMTEGEASKAISACQNLKDLEKVWFEIPTTLQPKLLALKNQMKTAILKPQTV